MNSSNNTSISLNSSNSSKKKRNKRKRKLPPLHNDGDSAPRIRINDLKKSLKKKVVNGLPKKASSSVWLDHVKKPSSEQISNADVLDKHLPLKKRARTTSSGTEVDAELSSDASSLESLLLRNGDNLQNEKKHNQIFSNSKSKRTSKRCVSPIKKVNIEPVSKPHILLLETSSLVADEQEEQSYLITTLSDNDEELSVQQNNKDSIKSNILSKEDSLIFTSNDDIDDEEDLSESNGIDLMEDSEDDAEDLEEEEADSDMQGFIVGDDEEISEVERTSLDSILDDADEEPVFSKRQTRSDTSASLTGFFPELRESTNNVIDEDDSDEDFTSGESDGEHDEDLSEVSAEELNELLMDISGDDGIAMSIEDQMDESDLERFQNLDPDALIPKPIGLAIDGYIVNEDKVSFVRLDRDVSYPNYTSQCYELFCFSDPLEHSVNTAAKALKWLIAPLGVQDFFEHVYGKKGLCIHRQNHTYYDSIFSYNSFYRIFQQNFLRYYENVNVANYLRGIRTTHNPQGRAYAGAIKSFIDSGMSIQCVNPQTFDQNLHYICDLLQELFTCFVGTNCYYTPKGSAGFAPHFDDVDALLIQTEGRKHWSVYAPSEEDQWPLESSENFTVEEMEERADRLVFSGWVETGDLLYLPRGFIHCAKTDATHDSLHVTISFAQKHSFSDLMDHVNGKVLEAKTNEIAQLRRNLPINLLDICGVADVQYDSEDHFFKHLERPISLYLNQYQLGLTNVISAAVDEIAREFMRKALPPLLTDYEKKLSVHGSTNNIPTAPLFHDRMEVRTIRKHTQRLLFESESKAFLAHRMENSMVYEGYSEVLLDVPTALIDGVEKLCKDYPDWNTVREIGPDMDVNKVVVQFLYEKGLLLIRDPTTSLSPNKIKPVQEEKSSSTLEADSTNSENQKKTHKKQKKKKKGSTKKAASTQFSSTPIKKWIKKNEKKKIKKK